MFRIILFHIKHSELAASLILISFMSKEMVEGLRLDGGRFPSIKEYEKRILLTLGYFSKVSHIKELSLFS